MCVFWGVGRRGGGWKKYVKYVRAKWEVAPLETYISAQGGRGGGVGVKNHQTWTYVLFEWPVYKAKQKLDCLHSKVLKIHGK